MEFALIFLLVPAVVIATRALVLLLHRPALKVYDRIAWGVIVGAIAALATYYFLPEMVTAVISVNWLGDLTLAMGYIVGVINILTGSATLALFQIAAPVAPRDALFSRDPA